MSDELKKHRVIGIRHTLRKIKDAGLISDAIQYPAEAVTELKKTQNKAENAKRHRNARKDAAIPSLIKTIEKTYDLPEGCIQIVYPSGRKAGKNATVGTLRKNWNDNS